MSVSEDLASYTFDHPRPGCLCIRIGGELDACSAPRLEEALQPQYLPEFRKLVLDLTDVRFIDSTGIRLLVMLLHRRTGDEEVVAVKPAHNIARRALDIVGLSRVVPLTETLDDALQDR